MQNIELNTANSSGKSKREVLENSIVMAKKMNKDCSNLEKQLHLPSIYHCDNDFLGLFFDLFLGETISFLEIKSYTELTGRKLALKRDYRLLRRISQNAVNKIRDLREK